MKTLLGLICTTSLAVSTHAAASCSECNGQTCILDGTSTILTGGATSLVVQFCNYDRTTEQGSSYALRLGASSLPGCDTSNATLPTVASLVAADGCTLDNCAVTIHFASALDWAIVRPQVDGQRNTLTAQLLTGGNTNVVTIATLDSLAPAVVNGGATGVSVCARALAVSGSRFSSVEHCNVVQICRGPSGSAICTTGWRHTDARVQDVQCSGEACTGKVKWTQPLPCDGSVGDATSLILSVTVASTSIEASPLANVGYMVAPTFNISAVSGLDVGSADVVLKTDTFCDDASLSLNVSMENASDDVVSSDAVIDVRSVNTTTNGTVIVQLASPLSSDLVSDNVQLSLSQCGVSSLGLFPVGENLGDFTAVSTGSTADANEGGTGTGPVGSVSTQEMNVSAGLSNSIIVGAVIGAVALAGFMFEYIYHKRRQPPALAQESSIPTPV
uniref:Uncharacterized protein n=1 Tax=Peronospora matthiolae TaxID=2874970 RepID=A0AAV1VCQ5_9STRA